MTTRTQYVNYLYNLIGYYGMGAGHAENDTPFNTWFYGHRVSGLDYAWCAVLQCYAENHFGLLALNGGKVAYVPAMPDVARNCGATVWSRPKRGSGAYKPGNKIGFDFNKTGEAEHTGTFWKQRDSSTFYSIDGNTGIDQVDVRIRRYADVLFVVELLGVDEIEKASNDVPDYVSLTTNTSIAVEADKELFVKFDKELSDKAGRHASGESPGIFVGGKDGSVYDVSVDVNGPVTWQLCEMRKDGSDWKVHDHKNANGVDFLDAGNHLWLKLTPHQNGDVTVGVKCAIWDR